MESYSRLVSVGHSDAPEKLNTGPSNEAKVRIITMSVSCYICNAENVKMSPFANTDSLSTGVLFICTDCKKHKKCTGCFALQLKGSMISCPQCELWKCSNCSSTECSSMCQQIASDRQHNIYVDAEEGDDGIWRENGHSLKEKSSSSCKRTKCKRIKMIYFEDGRYTIKII